MKNRLLLIVIITAFLCATFLVPFQGIVKASLDDPEYAPPLNQIQQDEATTADACDNPISPNTPCTEAAPSFERAPNVAAPGDVFAATTLSPLVVPSSSASYFYPAYAVNLTQNKLIYIPDITNMGLWDDLGDVSGSAYYAADFVGGNFNNLYLLDANLNQLHMIDIAALMRYTIGPSEPITGTIWSGATGTVSGTLYASSVSLTSGGKSYLYTIDTLNGNATLVGEITNAPGIIDIAINPAGEMYGVDIANDVLVQIDPATGVGTVIGPIGFDANYTQGMDFEDTTGVLYLAAYNNVDSQGELRIVNTATGNTEFVKRFYYGRNLDALAFAEPVLAPVQILKNSGFENGWDHWSTESNGFMPMYSTYSYSGTHSAHFWGQESWLWQPVYIPSNVTAVTVEYLITGISTDPEYNDWICTYFWDFTRQTVYTTGSCTGMRPFYDTPMKWKLVTESLDADQLASIAGKQLLFGFKFYEEDWQPGYDKNSDAYVDWVHLDVTAPPLPPPTYTDIFLPMVIR